MSPAGSLEEPQDLTARARNTYTSLMAVRHERRRSEAVFAATEKALWLENRELSRQWALEILGINEGDIIYPVTGRRQANVISYAQKMRVKVIEIKAHCSGGGFDVELVCHRARADGSIANESVMQVTSWRKEPDGPVISVWDAGGR